MHNLSLPSASFFFNSDLSGEVIIKTREREQIKSVKVDGADLLAFIAEYIRSKKIADLENATVDEILLGSQNEPR